MKRSHYSLHVCVTFIGHMEGFKIFLQICLTICISFVIIDSINYHIILFLGGIIMKLAIFAKKRQTKDGKPFTGYVTRLTKKDGEEVSCGVKFREECGSPRAEQCPCYIEVDKKNANLSSKTKEITTEDGELIEVESKTLWVQNWEMSSEEYRDTSLDDFID